MSDLSPSTYKYAERVRQGLKAPLPHGKSKYSNEGCKCVVCRADWTEYNRKRRYERRDALLLDPTLAEHGTRSTYLNWMCRCRPCKNAQAAYGRARRRELRQTKGRQNG